MITFRPLLIGPLRPGCGWFAAVVALSVGELAAQSGSDFPVSRGDMEGRSDGYRPRPVLLFYPPYPPPLGRAISRPPQTATPGRTAAPAELAAYVNEPFYPPLGTRLATQTLSPRLRAQLEQYRAARTTLLAELRSTLERVVAVDPARRLEELTALARKQGPALAQQEATAEQLRRDLIDSDNHWSALRQWRLGDGNRRGDSPVEIAQVMRGYAYYENALLPAQRRLLREISLELVSAADNPTNATAAQPYLFFPPEPARVLLPDDLPAEIAAKVAAYQTRKSQLKKELYDAVFAYDGKGFSLLRGNTLKAVAQKQAAPLAELERMAEEIRRALGTIAEPTAVREKSPLSPVLQNRVARLMARYADAQKAAAASLETLTRDLSAQGIQASYRFDADGVKFVVFPSRARRGAPAPTPATLELVEATRARMTAVADDYGRQLAELINEKNALLTEIPQSLGQSQKGAVDAALQTAIRVATAEDTADLYREYRIVVFQPGLSPEQRRLLFDAVMERLELPLPRGEFQPMNRSDSW
jgi:hypothetical protein